jgi:hypothetical protein
MRWCAPTAFILTVLFSHPVLAQGFTTSDLAERKHRDFVGKPCLETTAEAKPLVSDPRIMNHVVILDNHCPERIKVQVCYHGTNECTDVDVPPRARKDQIIGVFPAMQQFRYDLKEQF